MHAKPDSIAREFIAEHRTYTPEAFYQEVIWFVANRIYNGGRFVEESGFNYELGIYLPTAAF